MHVSSGSVSAREVPFPPHLSPVLETVARALTGGVPSALDVVLGPALEALTPTVPGARWASITRRHDTSDDFATPAFAGELALRVDNFQYELGGGPCLEAAGGATVVAGPVVLAARWPELADRAFAETPVRAVMSHPLPGLERVASLNLYSDDDDAFTGNAADAARAAAELVAATCAVGVAGLGLRARADNLEVALTSSRQIGAAVGIIMAQQRCTYDGALSVIRAASQRTQRKIREIAEEIVLTGALPDGA